MPALLNSTVSPPSAAGRGGDRRVHASGSPTSATNVATPVSAVSAAAPSASTSTIATVAPSSTMRTAVAAPMPDAPPVMTRALPSSIPMAASFDAMRGGRAASPHPELIGGSGKPCARRRPLRRVRYFLPPSTASLNPFNGVIFAAFLAGILIGSPVAGFRPMRAVVSRR